ncbi:MAG: AAA family ATPase [Leptospira sp.]|nr:AAA family ATPase [Leptospira sp.]
MKTDYLFKIDGYEITSRLPSNTKREIYLGQSETTGKKVIVKNVSITDDLNSSVINLKNEFKILNYLQDILGYAVYDFVKHSSGFALVMDFVTGDSLKEKLKDSPVTISEFFDISIELLENIQRIHQKKIIHKDIKPDNVIFNDGKTQIIDFGISTRLTKQESNWTAPNVLEGSIPYISPEQTGRMNRSIDYRTDYYSLGITFYELITGKLPFHSDDLLEIIHSHLAKNPESPSKIRAEIPDTVSAIILKLLNKTAEERYQSTRAIISDLKKCRDQYNKNGKVESFNIAENDYSDEFKIPQKLYGREKEVSKLIDEYESAMYSGQSRMVLISGYSGIGKSSLVKEIYKPMTKSKSHFITGKYDQYNKNIPYSAIIQSLTELIKLILTEPPESIQIWKDKILKALGGNGKIITDAIPELEYIIGKQNDVIELSAQENANRFYAVFQDFIKTFADKEHPLVLFLDDLQWADNPSLDFIKSLITDYSVKYFFVMLSYRDNEVDTSHPFQLLINDIAEEGILPELIELKPLTVDNLADLVSEALSTDKNSVQSLASIIYSKTNGNPFFVSELLKQLISEELIYLKTEGEHGWHWDEEKIQSSNISENVVELLLKRITKLSEDNQEVLKYSSIIGSKFDLKTLIKITELDEKQVIEIVKKSIEEELFTPIGESFQVLNSFQDTDTLLNATSKGEILFKFQHDRIQQACYNLVEENLRKEIHLKIARIQKESLSNDSDDNIFDVVNHYNIARDLVVDKSELNKLIELNYKGANRAKLANAYPPALIMILVAKELNEKIGKKSEYFLSILMELAELEYLNGNLDESEKVSLEALKNTDNDLIKANIYNLLITQYSARGMYDKALESINNALEPFGMNLPTENLGEIIAQEMKSVGEKINSNEIKALIDLDEMIEPEKIAAVKILIGAIPTAYNKLPELFPIISLKMVKLHLEYGNLGDSYGYAMYGIVLNSTSAYKESYEFCNLAVNISEKHKNPSGLTKACNILANYAIPFVRHIKYAEEVNIKCVKASLESGELLHGSYGAMNDSVNIFYQGKRLDKIIEKHASLYAYVKKVKNNLAIDTVEGSRLIVSNLKGTTSSHLDFSSENLTEEKFVQLCTDHQSLFPVCLFKIMKARSLLIYGENELAYKELQDAEGMLSFISGQYSLIEFNFNQSMVMLQLYKSRNVEERKVLLAKIRENQKQLKILANQCPENYSHKYMFIDAELARVQYKNWKAAKLYDNAIMEARKNDFIQNEAHFLEAAANFWFSKGNNKIASQYILESFQKYKAWGAEKKAELLFESYSDILSETKKTATITASTSSTQTELYSGQSLDLQSVLKSSNAISGEIKLESLFSKLLQILIENAGAERGILLLKRNDHLTIEAVGDVKKPEVDLYSNLPVKDFHQIASSVVYYVERTKENLVITDGMIDDRFKSDPYISKYKIKSILCSPILKHGDLTGILYLENNLTEGAFTADRLQIVNMLSSQAAISLDNALLYNNLEEKVEERTHQLALVNQELEHKNQHITDSINYALNIQVAILPAKQELKSAFKDIFILFLPKDIVSGDFYWFSKTDSGSKFIAAVDCTGHGVPGALMSMIGNTLLNHIVNERNVSDPGEILTMLNNKVRSVLRQDSEDANSTDGMDMCICRIDDEKIFFAGAKRPLYLAYGGDLIEHKGDRYSIGGRQQDDRVFQTIPIDIPKDKQMTVYLTTDGFVDQPNPDRLKIGSKELRRILQENSEKDCNSQFIKLKEKLDIHSNGEPQRDDITILGFIP